MPWRRNILVVANVTATSDELLAAMAERAAAEATAFTLIVPATASGGGRSAAGEKLEAALGRLREAGLEIEGAIGDTDPICAVAEAYDPRRYDEIIVTTLPGSASRWMQADLPHRIERLTGAPVTHIVARPPSEKPATTEAPSERPQNVLTPLTVLGWGRPS